MIYGNLREALSSTIDYTETFCIISHIFTNYTINPNFCNNKVFIIPALIHPTVSLTVPVSLHIQAYLQYFPTHMDHL